MFDLQPAGRCGNNRWQSNRRLSVTTSGAPVYNSAPSAVTFTTTQQSMTRLLAGAPMRRQPGRFTQPWRVGIIEELA